MFIGKGDAIRRKIILSSIENVYGSLKNNYKVKLFSWIFSSLLCSWIIFLKKYMLPREDIKDLWIVCALKMIHLQLLPITYNYLLMIHLL